MFVLLDPEPPIHLNAFLIALIVVSTVGGLIIVVLLIVVVAQQIAISKQRYASQDYQLLPEESSSKRPIIFNNA
jgi:hypothetical protein